MNRTIICSIIISIVINSCDKSSGTGEPDPPPPPPPPPSGEKQWTATPAFPGPGRKYATSFVVGNKFYVGLGSGIKNNAQQDLDDFYEYDIASGSWAQKANFPGGPRENSLGFTINGKGYIGLGNQVNCTPGCTGVSCCTDTHFTDFWEYNNSNDTWTKVADFTTLSFTYFYNYNVLVLNNKAYFLTQANTWEFDPATLTITPKTAHPTNVLGTTSFTINNRGYVATGDAGGPSQFSQTVYEYEPITDKWVQKADFPGPGRRFATGFAINGTGYVACGESTKLIGSSLYEYIGLKDVWEYNPVSDSWKKSADYSGNKSFYKTGGVSGNTAFIGTGTTYDLGIPDAFLKEFYIYK